MNDKTQKLKGVRPSLRERKRYVSFEVIGQHPSFQAVSDAITGAVLSFIGVKGVADAGIINVADRWDGSKGVVRVSNRFVDHVKSSFLFINEIAGRPAMVRSLRVSGMLGKA